MPLPDALPLPASRQPHGALVVVGVPVGGAQGAVDEGTRVLALAAAHPVRPRHAHAAETTNAALVATT